MSTLSEPANLDVSGSLDINELLHMDSEMDATLVEACLQVEPRIEVPTIGPLNKDGAENDVQMETQMSIKMEFSCSPERLCEPNDFDEFDVIEICSIHDSEDENSDDGILSIINTKSNQFEPLQEPGDDDGENEQLSFVMNDHNYSSQNISSPKSNNDTSKDLQSKTIDSENANNTSSNIQTPSKETAVENNTEIDENERRDMEEFIDKILKDDERKKEELKAKPKIEPHSEALANENSNDPELFLQNVMDEITAEDAADEAAQEAQRPSKGNESKTSETDLNQSNTTVEEDGDDDGDETETCSFQSAFDDEINSPTKKKVEDASPPNKSKASNGDLKETVADHSAPSSSDTSAVNDEQPKEFSSQEPQIGTQTEAINETAANKEPLQSEHSSEKIAQKDSTENSSTEAVEVENSEAIVGAIDDNMSEPLEITDFEDRFDQFDLCMQQSQSSSFRLPLLKELTTLVRDMDADCAQFATATTDISSRLSAYIVEKFEAMRLLVRQSGIAVSKDQEQQTDPKFERKRLKKLNKKDKRDLLASTDSSSSSSSVSSSSSSSSSDEHEKKRLKKPKHKPPSSANSLNDQPNILTTKSEKEAAVNALQLPIQPNILDADAVYDDGVNMTKYLRSDVFSAVVPKPLNDLLSSSSAKASSSSADSTDDEGNAKHTPKEKPEKEKVAKVKKSKRRKLSQTDENDREIERLINLDGLMKRPPIPTGSTKTTEIEKSKVKSSKQKTDDILDFLEKDLAKDSLSSDESVHEDEEEVITEKQYLERYNADVKRQLLDDSSNDTSQGEETDNEFAPVLSDDSDSGGGHRSPLVDKFLKTYNVEESEEENTTTPVTEAPAVNNESLAISEKKATEPSVENEKAEEVKSKGKENAVATISDNSDCELLNDNFIYRKRTQPKTLEKILSEAEKRKKIQKLDEDLISLSSESECSDVEAVDVEPAESKSRTIKPMLRPDQLHQETLKAQKKENERIRRLDRRQSMLSRILKEQPEMNKETELVLDYMEESKTFVKVHPDLVKLLKPHQREGVRFMYDSVYGGVEALKKNHGSGCILAHCMGLGKTLQLIALMHTVVSYKELKTRKILVLCPKSTVMNWGDEIIRWLYPLASKNLKVFTFSDTSDINEKLEIMREWSSSKRAGCLLVGYEAFRTLVFYHKYKMRHNLDAKRLDTIRDTISSYLLEPGADLVVCDEGHIIKNSKSAISAAVAEIKTQKRIVLTGTPIQNNLKEYYSMVNFIKPLFLGTEKEFANMYANPIKNGQHKDSSKKDIKVMKQRSFVLHKKLSKFVQRKEAELLKTFLPKKFEYVLFVPMTDVQNKLYERILEDITSRTDSRGRSLITDYTCLRKIWTHPKVLEDAWKNAVNLSFKRNAKANPTHSDDDQPDDIYDSQVGFMSVKNDWWRNLIAEKDLESILPSNKLRTMFEILRMCEENGDKCLIFSAFVAVLNVVEYFFQRLTSGDTEIMNELNLPPGTRSVWEPNKDYFRLDGKTSKSTRHEMIKRFNHPQTTRARVFLISAKAGGQGINLIGANRVIILDTSWNPSNDQQNIFRVFRLGQKKNCYIYRLLALGSMEEKVYSRSVTKQAMSFRVVDVQQIDRHYSMAELAELYTLTIPKFSERPTPVFPQDNILANLLRSFPDLVYKYHEHDSLLENKVEQELSEQDKIDAWDAYERDLQMNSQLTQMPNMEDLQNRLSQGQMPNYMSSGMGAMAGLDFQSLLNFRSGMGQAQTSASFMNPLLQQYNNLSNQQYLEILHTLRQYTSSATSDKSAYAAAYANMYGGVMPAVSPHHTSGGSMASSSSGSAAMHPLNALNDLSMYGLGGSNAATGNANPSSMYPGAPSTPGMPPVSSPASLYANPTYYDQFLQKYGYNLGGGGASAQSNNNLINNAAAASALSSFTNSAAFQTPRRTPPQTGGRKSSTPDLLGYRASIGNNASSMATTPTTTSASLAASLASLIPSAAMSPGNNASKSNADYGNFNSNKTYHRATSSTSATTSMNIQQPQHQPIPTSIFPATSNTLSTSASGSIYSSSKAPSRPSSSTTTSTAAAANKAIDAQIRVKDMGQLVANSMRANAMQSTANTGSKEQPQSKSKNTDNNAANNTGRQRQYTGDQSRQLPTKSQTPAELLKARGEMQIIPTTSPPGTASISKQLSEMSPSISLTAVRNNNAGNNNVTSKSASGTVGNSRNNANNTSINSNSAAAAILAQRQAQQISQQSQQQQQVKKPNSSATTNLQISSKMATLTKVTANTVEMSKKPPTNKSPLTLPNTSLSSPTNNNNNNGAQINKKSNLSTTTSVTQAAAAVVQKAGAPSTLRLQQFRKAPPTVPIPPSGAAVIYPSSIQASKTVTAATPIGSTRPNNIATTTSNAAKVAYSSNNTSNNGNKKLTIEKQNSVAKVTPNVQTQNATKIITNSNEYKQQSGASNRAMQSPTTVRVSASGTMRTASPTGTTIVRKPTQAFTNSNSSGLQISAVSNYSSAGATKTKPTSLAASVTTKIPNSSTSASAVPVQIVRSGSSLNSVTRSPAQAATTTATTLKLATNNKPAIRSNQSTLATPATITPKIANVTSLNTSNTTAAANTMKTVKSIPNLTASVSNPAAAINRSRTSVQLNAPSMKLLQEKRLVSAASVNATAPVAIKMATAASTLLQQKQRIANAGSTLSQASSSNQQQKNPIQRSINVRPIQKPNTVDSNVVIQTINNRSGAANLQGIPKFILDRKRKPSDANSKDSGTLSKRPKDF